MLTLLRCFLLGASRLLFLHKCGAMIHALRACSIAAQPKRTQPNAQLRLDPDTSCLALLVFCQGDGTLCIRDVWLRCAQYLRCSGRTMTLQLFWDRMLTHNSVRCLREVGCAGP